MADQVQSSRDRRFIKYSYRWRRETRRIARLRATQARQRREQLHVWTSRIVALAGGITVVASDNIQQTTKTPRGTQRCWGASVRTVSALNRIILDQAPGLAIAMLAYKAEEAGIRFSRVEDASPNIAIGRELVTTGKEARRIRHRITKEMKHAV